MRFPMRDLSEAELRRVMRWQTRVLGAPKFGVWPVGPYQVEQFRVYRDLARQVARFHGLPPGTPEHEVPQTEVHVEPEAPHGWGGVYMRILGPKGPEGRWFLVCRMAPGPHFRDVSIVAQRPGGPALPVWPERAAGAEARA